MIKMKKKIISKLKINKVKKIKILIKNNKNKI